MNREALPRVDGLIHPRPETVLYSCLVLWNHRERSDCFASLQRGNHVISRTGHRYPSASVLECLLLVRRYALSRHHRPAMMQQRSQTVKTVGAWAGAACSRNPPTSSIRPEVRAPLSALLSLSLQLHVFAHLCEVWLKQCRAAWTEPISDDTPSVCGVLRLHCSRMAKTPSSTEISSACTRASQEHYKSLCVHEHLVEIAS